MARVSVSPSAQAIDKDEFFISQETPTGSINGSNKAFTLAYTPLPATSLRVYFNGQRQTLTSDYTLSGDALTLIVAIPTGTDLKVDYHKRPTS